MNNILLVLIYGLATWRLSHILVHEEGPFRIFDAVRGLSNRLGWGEDDERRSLGQLFGCLWCMSVWVAAFFVIASEHFTDEPAEVLMWTFALSAVSVCYEAIGSLWKSVSIVVRNLSYK